MYIGALVMGLDSVKKITCLHPHKSCNVTLSGKSNQNPSPCMPGFEVIIRGLLQKVCRKHCGKVLMGCYSANMTCLDTLALKLYATPKAHDR